MTSIQRAPHKKDGYPTNTIVIRAYPSLEHVAEILDVHDSCVLFNSVGPDGDVVCTGARDENLMFWRIWEFTSEGTKKVMKSEEGVRKGF